MMIAATTMADIIYKWVSEMNWRNEMRRGDGGGESSQRDTAWERERERERDV